MEGAVGNTNRLFCCKMPTYGPNSPSKSSKTTIGGAPLWSTIENVFSSNDNWAVCFVDVTDVDIASNILRVSGFGFSVPGDETITGILFEIERNCDLADTGYDHEIKLLKNGAVTGDNKASGVPFWPLSDAIIGYGGQNDVWGATLSPSDINNDIFGLNIKVVGNNDNVNLSIDHVRATIYTGTEAPSSTVYYRIDRWFTNGICRGV